MQLLMIVHKRWVIYYFSRICNYAQKLISIESFYELFCPL